MSIKVMSWVWDQGPDDQTELLVLLALADIADDAGKCWPSVGTLAGRCRMSDRNVRRVIRKLEDGGWLATEQHPGRNRTNTYRIQKPDTAMSARTICPPGQNEQENRTKSTTKPDTAMSAEPSRTIKEPSIVGRAREILSTVLSEKVADQYINHRKAKRSKLTDHAAELIADKLRNHPDPDEVVKVSIMNGWTGVFPEKVRANPSDTFDRITAKLMAEARGEIQ